MYQYLEDNNSDSNPIAFETQDNPQPPVQFDTEAALKDRNDRLRGEFLLEESNPNIKREYLESDIDSDIRQQLAKQEEYADAANPFSKNSDDSRHTSRSKRKQSPFMISMLKVSAVFLVVFSLIAGYARFSSRPDVTDKQHPFTVTTLSQDADLVDSCNIDFYDFYLTSDGDLYMYDTRFNETYLADNNITAIYYNENFSDAHFIYATKENGSRTGIVKITTSKEYQTLLLGEHYPQMVSSDGRFLFYSDRQNGGMLYVYDNYSETSFKVSHLKDSCVIASNKKGDAVLIRDNITGDIYGWNEADYRDDKDLEYICSGKTEYTINYDSDTAITISFKDKNGMQRVAVSHDKIYTWVYKNSRG
jgi:hypothetical protein